MAKSRLSRKGFISLTLLHHCLLSSEESRAGTPGGNWRWELRQRPWHDAVYWLAGYGLLSLLSCSTQHHQPRAGTIHNVQYQLVCGLILWRHFLSKFLPLKWFQLVSSWHKKYQAQAKHWDTIKMIWESFQIVQEYKTKKIAYKEL